MEFIYGDDYSNEYLRLRKKFVAAGTSPEDLFRHDGKWELQSLPGYVVCSDGRGTRFDGQLSGSAFSYEYINKGRNMDGRSTSSYSLYRYAAAGDGRRKRCFLGNPPRFLNLR